MAVLIPTDRYPRHAIPAGELDRTAELIRQHPDYATTALLIQAYRPHCLEVVSDPFARGVADAVVGALRAQTPYSVIRMGDGEMNILAFDAYDTPHLDRYSFAATVEGQEDAFIPDELWMLALREMMMSAVLQADIVGVHGLWRTRSSVDASEWSEILKDNPRGVSGYWRSLDYMLRLARTGLLRSKMIASAHLYFGLLERLDELFASARRVLLMTGKSLAVDRLLKNFPGVSFDRIMVGKPRDAQTPFPESPGFLRAVLSELPRDLRGCCCLIGAGPWAELYCGWVKQRGGVALDIGSGFDLLEGTISRPVHAALGLDKVNPYALDDPSSDGASGT
jgi:hypothetical protein